MTLTLGDIDWTGFEHRAPRLAAIERYLSYQPMWYRTNDYEHSQRVFALLSEAVSTVERALGGQFDARRALVLALIHDDGELVTGDVEAGWKLMMSPSELATHEGRERVAIDRLAAEFPATLAGYSYRDLLVEVLERQTLECQVVKWLDHYDAFGEAFHELYAGNHGFATQVDSGHGLIPLPVDYYYERFCHPDRYYPLIAPVFGQGVAPFWDTAQWQAWAATPTLQASAAIAAQGRPHTAKSIYQPSGNPIYDWWRQTLLTHLPVADHRRLWERRE